MGENQVSIIRSEATSHSGRWYRHIPSEIFQLVFSPVEFYSSSQTNHLFKKGVTFWLVFSIAYGIKQTLSAPNLPIWTRFLFFVSYTITAFAIGLGIILFLATTLYLSARLFGKQFWTKIFFVLSSASAPLFIVWVVLSVVDKVVPLPRIVISLGVLVTVFTYVLVGLTKGLRFSWRQVLVASLLLTLTYALIYWLLIRNALLPLND